MISKSLSTSAKYARLHQVGPDLAEFCQSMYPLLVSHSDDFGRLAGDVFTVKHLVVPTSPRSEADIERALQLLHDVDLVVWYEVEGNRYLQVTKFEPHQSGLHKRTKSKLPAVPGNSRKPREVPRQLNRTELKGTEQKGTEQKKSSAASAARPIDLAEDNLDVITKIAHEAIDLFGPQSSELTETVKQLCAQRRIAYNSTVVAKAIDSARVQKQRRPA